jgi:hypothetical protein
MNRIAADLLKEARLPRVRSRKSPAKPKKKRAKTRFSGRFMLPDRQDFDCSITPLVSGKLAIVTTAKGQTGDKVIIYADRLGRIEGDIVAQTKRGFTVKPVPVSAAHDRLNENAGPPERRKKRNAAKRRQTVRKHTPQPDTRLTFWDGRGYPCTVMDVSVTGAVVRTAIVPALGSRVRLGKMTGTVIRHLEDGIAIEFIPPSRQTPFSGARTKVPAA